MLKKTWLLIVAFVLLGYAFLSSPPFQTIAEGVEVKKLAEEREAV